MFHLSGKLKVANTSYILMRGTDSGSDMFDVQRTQADVIRSPAPPRTALHCSTTSVSRTPRARTCCENLPSTRSTTRTNSSCSSSRRRRQKERYAQTMFFLDVQIFCTHKFAVWSARFYNTKFKYRSVEDRTTFERVCVAGTVQ